MNLSYTRWRSLFLFGLGLSAGAAFCMKWMENDLQVAGEKFTILGLELFYSREKLAAVLVGLDSHVQTILRYHLFFDFAFMAGVYPAITSLCMMTREKSSSLRFKKILFVVAWLQLLAWCFDCIENYYLLSWLEKPAIDDDIGLYHLVVGAKWVIALTGILIAVPVFLRRKKK
jgi:hypothetical protein